MFRNLKFRNFKSLRDYSVALKPINVVVGPNNAGKSTILDAFRVLDAGLRFARRKTPGLISIDRQAIYGYDIPINSLPISLDNVHSDYRTDLETSIVFTFDNDHRLKLVFVENARCVLYPETGGRPILNTAQFKKCFADEIFCFPTLGPLEEEEELLTDEYVSRWRASRRANRLFRNIWHRQPDKFNEFREMVRQTWPNIDISPPELQPGYGRARLAMFCTEDRVLRELCWAGFGFQVWLQLLTHFLNSGKSSALVIDEPEIYLHPELQHRFFEILRSSGRQVIMATHSAEMVNEAEHDEVLLVSRNRRSARRVGDVDGLQEALFSIGSAQNIHLAKLSKGRKILFLEGQDYKLIKKIAGRLGLDRLQNDVTLTVVPIGGFTQRHRIEHAAWTFQQVLKADIAIAALLDRDYRYDDELEDLLRSVRTTIPQFHILHAKEIENYCSFRMR